jgi:hypothetical protein
MGDDGPKADARIVFLRNRLTSSLKCKDMVLDRLFAHEDYSAVVSSFLDTSETNRLLVFDAGKGELAAVRAGAPGRHSAMLVNPAFVLPPPTPPGALRCLLASCRRRGAHTRVLRAPRRAAWPQLRGASAQCTFSGARARARTMP